MPDFAVSKGGIIGHGNMTMGTDLKPGQDPEKYGHDMEGHRGVRVRHSNGRGAPMGFSKDELADIPMVDIEMEESQDGSSVSIVSATQHKPGDENHPLKIATERKKSCPSPKSPASPEVSSQPPSETDPNQSLSSEITALLETNTSSELKTEESETSSQKPKQPRKRKRTSSPTNSEVISKLSALTSAVSLLSKTCEQMETSLSSLQQKQSSPSESASEPFEVTFNLPIGRFKFDATDVSIEDSTMLYVVFEADKQYLTPEEGTRCTIEIMHNGESGSFAIVSTGLTHKIRIDGKERVIVVFGLV